MNGQEEHLAERHDAAAPLSPGRRLGDFLLTRVVGQGGFGIVYEAEDLSLQRRVAIKEYMPAQLATRIDDVRIHPISSRYAKTFELGRRSFVGEARLLAQFRHPGLLEVLHFWEQNGTAYMVMPFYEGMTLDRVLASKPGIVTEQWLKDTIAPVLDALEHMHTADCYHRDVSADNILILDGGRALLLDLGAARRVIGDTGRALTVMLKPGYAPIEQYADDPACRQGPWTDIYALAAVMYFAVTGRMPQASASRVMHDSLPPLGSLQPPGYELGFLEAIDRGLSIRPERRPRSIAEFRSLLYGRAASSGTGSDGTRSTPGSGAPAGETRSALGESGRRIPTLLLATVAVAALSAGVVWLGSSADADSVPAQPPVAAKRPVIPQRTVAPSHTPAPPNPPAPSNTPAPATKPPPVPDAVAPQPPVATPARTAAAAATGTVRLAIAPWGEVFVDGARRGVTPPLKQLTLSPGRYRIEVRNPAATTLAREIVVEKGGKTVISHRFR
ncbi:MAG: serine/threonine protein kinase [Burkholderiales bacterium]|nr:MAG: serine/threonine protein kinase [Burkholderiales bacterium]